jgi:hypothetical protein
MRSPRRINLARAFGPWHCHETGGDKMQYIFQGNNQIEPFTRRSLRAGKTVLAVVAALLTLSQQSLAGSVKVCRTFDIATPLMSNLIVPAGSLFRDNGRLDDPLATFTGDRWQLRVETIVPGIMPPLQECVRILARITSDSSVKSVSAADNRAFVYAGSSNLLDLAAPSEELLSLKATIFDQVP